MQGDMQKIEGRPSGVQWPRGMAAAGLDGSLYRKSYSAEDKLEAVRAHLEGGLTAQEAMEKYGVRSKSAFFRWCAAYREQGEVGLAPKRRGRPRKNRE